MIIRILKVIVSIFYLFLVVPVRRILRPREGSRSFNVVIYYHSISNAEIRRFACQLTLLRFFTTIIPLDHKGDLDRSKRYSIITFDDAFQSVIQNAAPLLLKQGVPFTIFIPSGKLGRKADWGKYVDVQGEVVATAQELIGLPPNLVLLGSHTVNHTNLCTVSEDEALRELGGSKVALETLLGRTVRHLAFPYGCYDERVVSLCKKAGYSQVLTNERESPFLPIDEYIKGRIAANPKDWHIEFVLNILGGYNWMRADIGIFNRVRHIVRIRKKHHLG